MAASYNDEALISEFDGGIENESLESLTAKLEDYRRNLAEVKEAYLSSNKDLELEKLVSDLEELVALYEDLVEIKTKTEHAAKKQRLDQQWNNNAIQEGFSTHHSIASSYTPVPDGIFFSQQPEDHPQPTCTFLSRCCYAPYEDSLYIAEIRSTEPPNSQQPTHANVVFFGWENKETIPVNQIELIPFLPSRFCTPGTEVWAISVSSGLWKPASIVNGKDSEGNVTVRFKDSKEKVLMSLDRVSFTMPSVCVSPETQQQHQPARKVATSRVSTKEIITPGGYRIPESLRVNPQDTEKVKQIKKKKIQLIKKEQRRKVIEEEAQARQNSWKAHTSQNRKGMLHCKQSIFSTTDALEGKVGVTGSGKGMTHFAGRKRYVFDNQEEDIQ